MVEVPHLCGVFIRSAVFVLFVSATFVVHQKGKLCRFTEMLSA